ncbi:hypothetical protein PK28_16905 (plasmid) [Hymenobacter sp. DG25B]|uniref:hypothetical protein n=1 Tax=Hymenobacter sp. DG25B TaxID=1385664 RepID=UPI0005413188|nr:hypothetical protein [Hymenobacter sp. DG25B]AIZ65356.1 hypothetical protein PK28_16905 [Hymenobacter sp. DG25B]
MTPLTPADLVALLAPVPCPVQQRDEPVRLKLRASLPTDYRGPVALRDVRLALNPSGSLMGSSYLAPL